MSSERELYADRVEHAECVCGALIERLDNGAWYSPRPNGGRQVLCYPGASGADGDAEHEPIPDFLPKATHPDLDTTTDPQAWRRAGHTCERETLDGASTCPHRDHHRTANPFRLGGMRLALAKDGAEAILRHYLASDLEDALEDEERYKEILQAKVALAALDSLTSELQKAKEELAEVREDDLWAEKYIALRQRAERYEAALESIRATAVTDETYDLADQALAALAPPSTEGEE